MPVTINGSTGISSPGGDTSTSLSTGLLTVTGSTVPANGMYLPAANTLSWATNSTRNMTLDSSGNLAVGANSAADSAAIATFSGVSTVLLNASGSLLRFNKTAGTDTGWLSNRSYSWHDGNGLALSTQTADPLRFGTNNTERARIDSSGNLLVGATSAVGVSRIQAYLSTAQNINGMAVIAAAASGGGSAPAFEYYNSSNARKTVTYLDQANTRFYIVCNEANGVYLASGGTAWTSASDERLKTDLKPIESAVQKVSTLRAVTGRFKTDDEGVSRSFLIAQDVLAVLPEAVDSSDPDKLGVQYTDTIPLLVAAIKELTQRLEALEAK